MTKVNSSYKEGIGRQYVWGAIAYTWEAFKTLILLS